MPPPSADTAAKGTSTAPASAPRWQPSSVSLSRNRLSWLADGEGADLSDYRAAMTSSNAGQNDLAPLPTTPPPKHKSTTPGRPDHPDDNDNNNHIAPNAADQQQPSRTDASTTVHPSIEDASTKQQNTSIAVDTFMADADAGSAPPATMSQPASAVQVDADPFASSFPHTPMPNMDHAYMMMALAHMAGNQMSNQISPPPTDRKSVV